MGLTLKTKSNSADALAVQSLRCRSSRMGRALWGYHYAREKLAIHRDPERDGDRSWL